MIRLFELTSSDGSDLFILLEAAYNKLIYTLEENKKGGLHIDMSSDVAASRKRQKEFQEQATVMLDMNVSEIMGVSGGVDEKLKARLLREPDVPGTKYNLRDPSLPSLFVPIMINAHRNEGNGLWDDETGLITTHDTRAKITFGLSGNKITITKFKRE